MLKRKTAIHTLLLFVLLWLVSWWLNRSISIFVSDTGLRFVQIRELIANHWRTLAVSYPGRIFDPALAHVPYYFAYGVLDGEIYLNITPFMPLLSSWGYAAGGVAGMMLTPVLGGVLTAVAIYKLALLSQLPRPRLLLWVTIFATPMFFYSIELWDHTLAAACATWAVYLAAKGLLRQDRVAMLGAGVMIGLGLGQRPEMYLFAICLGMGLLLLHWRQWQQLLFALFGGVAGALPLWWWQYTQVGHPLGMALAANLFKYGVPQTFPVTPTGFPWFVKIGRKLFYIEARDPLTFMATLLVVSGIIIFIMAMRVERWQKPWTVWGSLGSVLLGYVLFVVKALQPIALNGVLSTFPLLVFALLFVGRSLDKRPQRPVYQFTFIVTMLFLAGMVLIWPAYGGLQWGARYSLPFFPLGVYLAFYTYDTLRTAWVGWRGRLLPRLLTAVVLVSVLLQLAGFYAQAAIHRENGAVRDGVAALPVDLIVTNGAYLPAESASLPDKIFLYAENSAALETLIPRFWEQGILEFAVLPLHFVPLPVPEQVGEIKVQEIDRFVYRLSRP